MLLEVAQTLSGENENGGSPVLLRSVIQHFREVFQSERCTLFVPTSRRPLRPRQVRWIVTAPLSCKKQPIAKHFICSA